MQDNSIGIVHGSTIDISPTINFITTHFVVLAPYIKPIITFAVVISLPLCLILFICIIIVIEKLKTVRRQEAEIFDTKIDMGYTETEPEKPKVNQENTRKWNSAIKHVESHNENDWRQAIIEADIILGDLLTHLGYKGEGIGEQLKRANKGDFKSLDEAWSAHKVRNELAHAGSDYLFSQSDARRVIQQYRKVFEEFFFT